MPRLTPAGLNDRITLAVATAEPDQLAALETLAARLGDRYSPTNLLAIWAQLPTATEVRGFRAWQDHGRVVAKGQKGLGVFRPNTRKKQDSTEQQQEEDPAGGARREVHGYHVGYVFDLSQTVPTDCEEPRGACTCPPPDPAAPGHVPDRQALADAIAAFTPEDEEATA